MGQLRIEAVGETNVGMKRGHNEDNFGLAETQGLYVVADGHPVRRRDWYGTLAKLTDSPEPRWDTAAPRPRGADKRINPTLLFDDLGFRPAHPNPLAALADLVETSS